MLSIFDNNGLSSSLPSIDGLSSSEDIHLAKLYGSSSPSALIYTTRDPEYNVRHVYACSSDTNIHDIAESTSKVHVLNDDAESKFPKVSYSSGKLGTVKYASLNDAEAEVKALARINEFTI